MKSLGSSKIVTVSDGRVFISKPSLNLVEESGRDLGACGNAFDQGVDLNASSVELLHNSSEHGGDAMQHSAPLSYKHIDHLGGVEVAASESDGRTMGKGRQ